MATGFSLTLHLPVYFSLISPPDSPFPSISRIFFWLVSLPLRLLVFSSLTNHSSFRLSFRAVSRSRAVSRRLVTQTVLGVALVVGPGPGDPVVLPRQLGRGGLEVGHRARGQLPLRRGADEEAALVLTQKKRGKLKP